MSIHSLYQYAAACQYPQHGYLSVQKDGSLAYGNSKGSSVLGVATVATQILKTSDASDKKLVALSLASIRDRWQFKSYDLDSHLFFSDGVQRLSKALEGEDLTLELNEGLYRLKFLNSLPQHLAVKAAPGSMRTQTTWKDGAKDDVTVNEWDVVKWLSEQVFNSKLVQGAKDPWKAYSEIMLGAYRGDHFLIQDDEAHTKTTQLRELGAILRASSHNEKGRPILGWDDQGNPVFGGDLHADMVKVPENERHYGLTGNHFRHILFYAADMKQTTTGELIYAKTARQIDNLAQKGQLIVNGAKVEADQKVHHYVAFQMEPSPDSEGNDLKDSLFYRHRLAGFVQYRALKAIGVVNANVGPYGYGRTDMNPLVLEVAKL